MSVMGTSIAAGVAQTAHTAQQVARQQDKRRNDAARAAHEVRDRYEHLIQDLEEGEDSATAARVVIDDHTPGNPGSPENPENPENPAEEALDGETDAATATLTSTPPLERLASSAEAQALRQRLIERHASRSRLPDAAGGLYHHLDVEA